MRCHEGALHNTCIYHLHTIKPLSITHRGYGHDKTTCPHKEGRPADRTACGRLRLDTTARH